MDFHELEAFVALAQSQHLAHAAAVIHISPSALSRLLSRLEEELGSRLFERDTRRMELTEEGEAFLAFARESLHRREDLRLRMGSRDGQLRGILRLYASVTACYSILPPFVEALAKAHPQLRLSVETGDPADAVDAVRDGRAELAVSALPPGGFPDLETFSVKRSPLVLVSSRSGPYGKLDLDEDGKESQLPADERDRRLKRVFAGVPLILPGSGLARTRFDRWTRERSVRAHIAAETAGNEAILALARLGLGLGLVPRLVLENGPFAEGLVLYNAGEEFGDYEIGFVQQARGIGSEQSKRQRAAIASILHGL